MAAQSVEKLLVALVQTRWRTQNEFSPNGAGGRKLSKVQLGVLQSFRIIIIRSSFCLGSLKIALKNKLETIRSF